MEIVNFNIFSKNVKAAHNPGGTMQRFYQPVMSSHSPFSIYQPAPQEERSSQQSDSTISHSCTSSPTAIAGSRKDVDTSASKMPAASPGNSAMGSSERTSFPRRNSSRALQVASGARVAWAEAFTVRLPFASAQALCSQ